MRSVYYMMFAVLVSYVVMGCGGGGDDLLEVYPTTGKLTLDDEPFGPTQIHLVPVGTKGGRSLVGTVDKSGQVTFTTYKGGDGVPAGEYRVAVGMVMGEPPRPFPGVYRSRENSPLKVTVTAKESNDLVIQMDSSAGPMVGGPSFAVKKKGGPDMSKDISKAPGFSLGGKEGN